MKFSIVFFVLVILTACSKDSPDGIWDDNIKLSQKEVQFDANENTIVITTEGEGWWIAEITLDNANVDISSIDTTVDNFVIDEPEFSIERKNTTEIHITVAKNETGVERKLLIILEAGDYFDHIIVTQAAN